MAEEKRVNFKDSEFMTAREKRLVLANWKTFLKHGLKQKHFTRRLYNHLHLNCGFIAHYNIGGFYATYFEHGADTVEFFKRFCDAASHSWAADYKDLNIAMLKVCKAYQASIDKKANDDIDRSLDATEESLNCARADKEFAREFVSSVRG
jgi:hypothetical protein